MSWGYGFARAATQASAVAEKVGPDQNTFCDSTTFR